jgi:hypothetical protein
MLETMVKAKRNNKKSKAHLRYSKVVIEEKFQITTPVSIGAIFLYFEMTLSTIKK